MRQYFREVRDEMRQVAWPTRPEVANYTSIVGTVLLIMIMLIFGLNLGFSQGGHVAVPRSDDDRADDDRFERRARTVDDHEEPEVIETVEVTELVDEAGTCSVPSSRRRRSSTSSTPTGHEVTR